MERTGCWQRAGRPTQKSSSLSQAESTLSKPPCGAMPSFLVAPNAVKVASVAGLTVGGGTEASINFMVSFWYVVLALP